MNMKKLVSMILALVMMLTMATGAMAAVDTLHVITIDNTTPGYTYEAYRVFSGVLVDGELTQINWAEGVNGTALLSALNQIPEFANCKTPVEVATVLSGITAKNDPVTQKFADAVAANLATRADSTNEVEGDGYKLNVTGDGYYFIKTTDVPPATETTSEGVHTRYILKVVGDVTVSHKGEVPTVEKKIVTDAGKVDSTDVNIGDTVTFELTATLPSDYNLFKTYTLIFHDTLSAGLTLDNGSFVVKVDGDAIASDLYAVKIPAEDGHTFDVVIADVKATAAGNDSVITVTYTAKLNSSADVGMPGNPNTVKLEYSNNPNEEQDGTPETGETPEDKVVVFTYELDVTKVDGVNESITLANAKFSLLNSDKTKIAKFDANSKIVEWVELDDVEADAKGVYPAEYTLTTGSDGIIKVIGLDAGTYYLRETEAPAGYNLPTSDFEVVITATTTVTEGADKVIEIESLTATVGGENASADKNTGIVAGTIENNSGATLPETGAQGTKMIYMVGGILVAAAAILLITKRRMNAAE